MSVILDDETRREIELAMAATGENVAATILRKAIRAGLPLVKSGGEAVRLSGELSDFVGACASRGKRTRESIIAEAVQRGIRGVDTCLMIEEARANGIPEGALASVQAADEMDLYPEKRAVRQALREKGALQIQLEDLLQHCPEARERKETLEKLVTLARSVRGGWPSMWGSGVSTAELQRQLGALETEAKTKGLPTVPAPEAPTASDGGEIWGSPSAAARATEKIQARIEMAKATAQPLKRKASK